MKNYRLKIAFDGTRYSGWERQPGRDTVQGKLEAVFTRLVESTSGAVPEEGIVEVTGAGRTDAGVHARALVANVHMDVGDMADEAIRDYANHYLPDDIALTDVSTCSDRFHARYNAKGRTYLYTIFDGPVKPVFNRRYYTAIDSGRNNVPSGEEPVLDVELMKKAAVYLIGEHDFKSFCGNPKMKKSTVRTVTELSIRRSKGYIYIKIKGSGFLQHMVRIIAGTLMEVGWGRMEPERVKEILEAKDRTVAGPTAPPEGLTLVSVDY